jgi:hypothetical protein
MNSWNKDKLVALMFMGFTLAFIVVLMTNKAFFDWVFQRHQHQWSWYIRPLFLIPFCYYAYKHSWTGISITVFCLFTSMFWFESPEFVADNVKAFLSFEKDWLQSTWNINKILLVLTIPISFFALGLALWKRSLLMGVGVIVLIATGKIIWSVYNAGAAGKSIIVPATIGLLLCIIFLIIGFKRLEKRKG